MSTHRTRALICATATLASLVTSVAFAGASGGSPPATTSASVKKTVKKLKQRVTALEQQLGAVEGQQGPAGPQGPPGPSTGPAGGDLTGSYPNPSIAGLAVGTGELANGAVTQAKLQPPAAFTDASVPDPDDSPCIIGSVPWCNLNPDVHNRAGYYRDQLGMVQLRGVVQHVSDAPNDPIFTLPAGYRPAKLEHQASVFSDPALSEEIQINPGGNVVAAGVGPGSSAWVSLDGVTFRCAPSGSNGCP